MTRKSSKTSTKQLAFYDVKAHKKFTSNDYKTRSRKVVNRRNGGDAVFAVARSPYTGNDAWRIVSMTPNRAYKKKKSGKK